MKLCNGIVSYPPDPHHRILHELRKHKLTEGGNAAVQVEVASRLPAKAKMQNWGGVELSMSSQQRRCSDSSHNEHSHGMMGYNFPDV